VVRVFVAMRNLIGYLDLVAMVCKWGRQHKGSSSLMFQGENTIQGMTLIGFA
jgi:hypothetical protein